MVIVLEGNVGMLELTPNSPADPEFPCKPISR
jgi:hypothetical protein